MDIQSHELATIHSKPTHLQPVSSTSFLLSAMSVVHMLDITNNKILHTIQTQHKSINSIRYHNNILYTGGSDNLIKVYDCRNWSLVHTFQRVPSKFQSIDVSEHILAAATSSSIVFWDLRKMKQRAQFKDSFNGDVLSIKFQDSVPTNLYGCSADGMINMFDLTQPNEQQAFNWCYKLLECPISLSAGPQKLLVRTSQHTLYKIQQGDLLGKTCLNNPESPKHILLSRFTSKSNYEQYEYYSWSPENKLIEKWIGFFNDSSIEQKFISYLNDVADVVEVFGVVGQSGVYADEKGKVIAAGFETQKKIHKNQNGMNGDLEVNGSKWKFSKKEDKKQQGPRRVTKNGYVLEKPVSSFAKHKKFKPY